jgi:hypothetical protein
MPSQIAMPNPKKKKNHASKEASKNTLVTQK